MDALTNRSMLEMEEVFKNYQESLKSQYGLELGAEEWQSIVAMAFMEKYREIILSRLKDFSIQELQKVLIILDTSKEPPPESFLSKAKKKKNLQ